MTIEVTNQGVLLLILIVDLTLLQWKILTII